MQIEEAIEKLKETAKQCRNSKECWENEDCCDCYVEVEDIFAIETVLNELEKKDKQLQEKQNIINKLSKECQKNFDLVMETEIERITANKVIDEMAEYIVDLIKYNNSEENRDKEDIKQYFSEKVSDK